MDDKRRDAGSPSTAATVSGGSAESPATEPPATRRRGQKRKNTASLNSGSSSAPPKRHLREKAAAAAAAASATVGLSSLFSPFHNGPLTRARQLSDTNAVLNAVKEEEETAMMAAMRDSSVDVEGCVEVVDLRSEEFKVFEADIEDEFNSIRSRAQNSHVVPVAAGWFSWTTLHPIEKQALPSFFNGKSESRTPEVYTEIRNWIMKRFHANPNTDIELKDMLELSSGDSDAKQEVLEFLDHWGLINYHPFAQNDATNTDTDPKTDINKTEKTDSLIKKLFQFENEKSFQALVPKANTAQTIPNGLLRESALAEQFIKQEGPAVEYHCNSCSADCSRKRYHCQKQADFDLCTECFNNGKFGSGMSSSDFILMEPGEASSASGGKWTDQETLLLLEALELFKENWNEIAEHVATKTKAQCILHFLQMPIEDSFLDEDDDTKDSVKEMAEPNLTSSDVSDRKDNLEQSEEKTSQDNPDQVDCRSGMDNSELSATKSGKDDPEPSERKTDTDAAQPGSTPMEASNIEEAQDGKLTAENSDGVILKALMEAFDAVGWPVAPQENLCFAEAGNSVMALAAFLAQLVDPNLAMASAHSSLRSISKSSPGSQLAARHCFILEDPPDDKNEQTIDESTTTEKLDQNGEKVVIQEGESDKIITPSEKDFSNMDDDKSTTALLESHSADDQNGAKKSSDPGDNLRLPSADHDLHKDKPKLVGKLDKEKVKGAETPIGTPQVAKKTDKKSNKGKSGGAEKHNKVKSKVAKKQNETTSTEQAGSKGVTEPANCTRHGEQPRPDGQDDSSSKVMPPPGSSDGTGNMHPSKEAGQSMDASKGIDMESSCAVSDKKDHQEAVLTDPVVGVGSETDEMKVDKSGDQKSGAATAVDDDVAKLKRAALATLSAAAVKAKLLADHEEDEIKQLAAVLIEKQLRKLEIKLSFFTEMEGTIMRVRELLERSKQKLFAERAQIIASRLGLPASARGVPSSHPLNRMPAGLLNSVLRPSMNMGAQRPPLSRSVMASAGPTANTSAPPEVPGYTSGPPMTGEKPSAVGTD
ncbi:hypothetical protein vseg_012657 [Gypsophila vaccaria]